MEFKRNQKTVFLIAATAKKKGVENPYQLHRLTGISTPRAARLWKGEGWLGTDDIDCSAKS